MSAIESTGALTPELLDLMQHEGAIERSVAEIGWHFKRIRDGRKYLAAGYTTFEDYCQQRWGWGRNYVNKQIRAAESIDEIESVLGTTVPTPLPETERQARPLAALGTPEEKAEAWIEAVEQSGGEQPTAATVTAIVKERTPKPVPKPSPKVNGERVDGAPPHPAVYSDAVLAAFRELLDDHANVEATRIVDPFAGTGRIHELQADDWMTLGVELEAEWAALHPDTVCGDSRQLAAVVYDAVELEEADVIATSPAYGNRLADPYYEAFDADSRRSYGIDLGRPLSDGSGAALQWGVEYRQLHETVWRECVDLLVPGGLFLLNCKDHQRDGATAQVTGWHVRTLIELGLTVIDLRTIPPAGLPSTTAAKLPELVVALRKGGPR